MATKKPREPGMRGWLRENVYVAEGQVFFRSRRGFRKLAAPRGILPSDDLPGFERIWVMVTLGWWIRSLFRSPKRFDAITVRSVFGRMGNQTFQLAHALTLASSLKANLVLSPGNGLRPPGRTQLWGNLTWDNRSSRISWLTASHLPALVRSFFSSKAHLVGTFFHITVLPQELVNGALRTATLERLREIWREDNPPISLDATHLVIHIRGDDAFGTKPHHLYGQPPLAFYQIVLEDGEWETVTVVSSDQANPVLPLLFEELDRRGIPYRFQSGSLEEDSSVVSSAQSIAASRGTFVPAITSLSPCTRTVYAFGEVDLYRKDLTVMRVLDADGEYWRTLCQGNWRNTPEQRALMLSYGKEHLRWGEVDKDSDEEPTWLNSPEELEGFPSPWKPRG